MLRPNNNQLYSHYVSLLIPIEYLQYYLQYLCEGFFLNLASAIFLNCKKGLKTPLLLQVRIESIKNQFRFKKLIWPSKND